MSANIVFDAASIQNMIGRCEEIFANVKEVSASVIELNAQEIMEESQAQIPKDTMSAMSTAAVMPVIQSDYETSVELGYVIANNDVYNPKSDAMVSEYIVDLHENMVVTHYTGKAKFLEDPMRAIGPFVIYELAQAIKQVL